MNRNILFSILLISLGLLSAQWTWPDQKGNRFPEKANLALRQVGHQLLTIAGDHTSTILPIQEKSETEYVLQLKNEFNYDTLPYLLDAALSDFNITNKYHVAVRDCATDTIVLGYHHSSFLNQQVACLGRDQKSLCNNVHIAFEKQQKNEAELKVIPLVLGLSGILFFIWNFFSKKKEGNIPVVSKNEGELKIGQVTFDHKNQNVKLNGKTKNLTFRENKLLHYFAVHPNQVLEREKILAEVWGDEGVIVGRSLDVFVSRLRKILKEDESLKIKNVHGVGYRLEVNGI